MDWSLTLGLTIAICIGLFLRLRIEKRRVRLISWMMIYPGALLLILYAWFYAKWLEVGAGLAAAVVIVAVWWVAYGSYLPPPTSDNISVWGQEAKKPAVAAAEAEAELERVRKEKEALERELERLKNEKDLNGG